MPCCPSSSRSIERGSAHRTAIDEYITTRAAPFVRVTIRAIERGELPVDVDPAFAALIFSAPFVYSILFGDQPLDDATAERVVAVAIAGLRAGEGAP